MGVCVCVVQLLMVGGARIDNSLRKVDFIESVLRSHTQ